MPPLQTTKPSNGSKLVGWILSQKTSTDEACWLQGSNVTEFETPMAIAGPRACDEPKVVSLKEMQLDAVLNCAKARMANLGDEAWHEWQILDCFDSFWMFFFGKATFATVCEDIYLWTFTFVSVSPPKHTRLFWAYEMPKRSRMAAEKELVAPEFMVKSDAVECQMCLV